MYINIIEWIEENKWKNNIILEIDNIIKKYNIPIDITTKLILLEEYENALLNLYKMGYI